MSGRVLSIYLSEQALNLDLHHDKAPHSRKPARSIRRLQSANQSPGGPVFRKAANERPQRVVTLRPMKKVKDISQELRKSIEAGLNVLLDGPHGIGKSSIVFSAARERGLQVKYFSASTLDPFADLVGVPVPVLDEHGRRLVFLRPDYIHQAEVLFFDELNRVHPKVLNAVFEIIQFHSINGESLPRLRSVIAAINPAGTGYQVQELDPALLDRFHVHLRVEFPPNREWFIDHFGQHLGSALVAWHQTDLDDRQRQAITNRRLEYIAIKAGIDPCNALPSGVTAPTHLLQARVQEVETVLNIEQFVENPEEFAALVAKDLNVALRFAQLLPMMRPNHKNRVRDIVLALPSEVLARLKSQTPFVFKQTCEAVARSGTPEDARAYQQLLNERLENVAA